MKIGILTHPLETNYGGLLQAFALQKFLRDMGHDVWTIDRHNSISYQTKWHNFLGFCKRNKEFYLDKKMVSTAWNPFLSEEEKEMLSLETNRFIKRNINVTYKVDSSKLKDVDRDYQFDAYVVGSDQVWLPGYCPTSFLDFVERDDVKRIFYAASCGKKSFADDKRLCRRCCELAQKFDGVSVREQKLIELSKKKLRKEAQLVLDPTFLLNPEDYLSAIDKVKLGDDVLFVYLLDNNKNKQLIVDSISKKLGLTPYFVNVQEYYTKGVSKDIKNCIFPSVDKWISTLSKSKFVITDSFHGTAMSILFNKQFVSIGNSMRGMERFHSLLDLFHLEERLIMEGESCECLISKEIKYDEVNDIIKSMRTISENFINKTLMK